MNGEHELKNSTFIWRVTSMHMCAYLIAALFAIPILNYQELLSTELLSIYMREFSSPIVALGPILQIVNGFFIALILIRIRGSLVRVKQGWYTLFIIVAGFSIFAPQAPAPGTFEGYIYTQLPIPIHLIGLPECLLYSFLFSFGLYKWYERPGKAWNIIVSILIIVIALISALGYLDSLGLLPNK